MIACGRQYHTGLRFAAVAVGAVPLDRCMRRMWAVVIALNTATGRLAHTRDIRVCLLKELLGEHPLRHAVLACHDDHLIAGAIQQADSVDGVGKQLQSFETIEIPNILDHRPVAIEEYSFLAHARVSWRNRRTVSCTRAVGIRFMQRWSMGQSARK